MGCATFSLGASFFIQSDLGTDPHDTFSLGVLKHLPLTVGIRQAVVAAACIATWALLKHHCPLTSQFVAFLLCGSLIDLLQHGRCGGGRSGAAKD